MNNGRNGVEQNGFSQEPTFQDYLQTVLRGKVIILVSFAVVLGATALYTFTTKPVYEATAAVLIDTKGQQSQLPLFDVTGIGAVKNIKNELEILKSRSLAEAVAGKLIEQKYTDESQEEPILMIQPSEDEAIASSISLVSQVVKQLETAVEFEPVRDSDVIKIIARSVQPREAALLANTYAQAYYDRNLYASRTRSRAIREFLEEQLDSRKASLDVAETALQGYMETKEIVSLDDEAKKVIEQLSELEAQRDAANINLETLSKTLSLYQEELTKLEPRVAKAIGEANDPYIRSLQEELAKLEVKRDVTVAQNPSLVGQQIYNQTLKEIDDQINALRAKLQQRTDEYLSSLIPGQRTAGTVNDPASFVSDLKQRIIETQIQHQELEAKKRALSDVISQYEKRFESIPQKHIQYARLQRSRLSNEKLYLFVEEKYNEAAIKEKSEFGYIDIIDPAVVSVNPVSPKKRLNLLLGAILGIGLGLAIVFVREYLDVRIRTPEDLKKRGLSVLTMIALMDDEIRKLGAKSQVEGNGKLLDTHLISYANPLSSIAESYRRLRTNIQYSQLDKRVQVILVTSSNPGEGKSTTVSNLAVTFAQTGKNVLLIDTDLRKPTLHSEFGFEKQEGITELLVGSVTLDKAIKKTAVEHLDLICCGSIPPNPAEILGSGKMKELIELLRSKYDTILLDSPPALAVTDPVVLATLADGVVVVISSGNTRMDALDRTIEVLENIGSKFLGFVLNNFDLRRVYGGNYGYYRNKYYSYGYGVNYGNGSHDSNNGNGDEKKATKILKGKK